MFRKLFSPIKSNAELITVGTGAITGVEVIDNSPFETMGTNGEIIKLSLQSIIAIAALIKYFRENKRKKQDKQNEQ